MKCSGITEYACAREGGGGRQEPFIPSCSVTGFSEATLIPTTTSPSNRYMNKRKSKNEWEGLLSVPVRDSRLMDLIDTTRSWGTLGG